MQAKFVAVILVLAGCQGSEPITDTAPSVALKPLPTVPQHPHKWTGISYPKVPTPFAGGSALPSIRATNGTGFRFTLAFPWTDEDEEKESFLAPDSKQLKLTLHYPGRKAVEPIESTFEGELMATGRRSYSCVFPWSENEMLEGWIELKLLDDLYWLEIPYGFTRNPKIEKLPTSRTGRPRFPAALNPFPKRARIVNWKHVAYDLGTIQNGWRLALLHSNPFDANSEVVLYRDDREIGKSMFLWDLHSPRTKLSIRDSGGFNLTSRTMSLRLHEDGFQRSDSFKFNRDASDDRLRDWGTMTIKVDEKNWAIKIPSSLFRYVHGVSDPYHESTLR